MRSVFGVELMRRSVRRRVLAFAAIVGATLLATSAPAHAQLSGGPGAVDQYVEDVPTGGGTSHPTADPPSSTPAPSGVQQQIDAQGGSDAPLLTQVVSSSTYGAPQGRAVNKGGGSSAERMERGGELPEAVSSGTESSGVVSSAVTAVEGSDARRLLGLLLALLAVTAATVFAVGLRQRRANRG
ncbi:MAG TPA: hypothetical protein VFO88_09100 [Gaiellaceae bacterium]|nr:hypothetical protein [Gaiellaceae bacterium]